MFIIKFLEGTRLDPSLELSKFSFPIYLLDKKDYVTSTKSNPRTNNRDDELLSTDKTFYPDFTEISPR